MPEERSLSLAQMLQEFDNSTQQVDSIKTKTRAFLLVQAKRELDRIVKLTEFLDRLEQIYQDRVMNYLSDERNNDASVFMLPQIIKTVSDCLTRSQEIIKLIAKDDKLFNLIYVDNSANMSYQNGDSANISEDSVKKILSDPSSRKRLREAVEKFRKNLADTPEEVASVIIDEGSEEEEI